LSDYLELDQQINILFELMPHPAGRPYTLQEVSAATEISLGTLSHIRNGKISNPGFKSMRRLSEFFGVPLKYFQTTSIEECYAIIADRQLEDVAEISEIAFRTTQLSSKSQRDVLAIIKWVQAAEELRKQGQDIPHLPSLNFMSPDSNDESE
jgi:transcriptional regulator with XRE-family HTH domain